jgi:hypothetical protein
VDDDALAYVAITRLQNTYADVVTRRAWGELEPLFLPDAQVHVDTVTNPVRTFQGAKELGDFIGGAIAGFEFFEFIPLTTVVDVAPDARTASARLYMVEIRQDAATGSRSDVFGLYRDRYARGEDGRWRFSERRYQTLGRTGVDRMDVFPIPGAQG